MDETLGVSLGVGGIRRLDRNDDVVELGEVFEILLEEYDVPGALRQESQRGGDELERRDGIETGGQRDERGQQHGDPRAPDARAHERREQSAYALAHGDI